MTLYDRIKAGTLVGTVVYRGYTPAVVGIITEVVSADSDFEWSGYRVRNPNSPTVRVKWDNPKRGTTDESTLGLSDFESLVTDHERKAVNHRATFERIKAGKPKEKKS